MEHNKELAENGYVLVKNFLDESTTRTFSMYFENKINRGEWVMDKNDPVSKYSYYADPLTEVSLLTALPVVEEIVGEELYPTYSFSRVYTGNEELKPHIDRPSCEISVTVNIARVGENMPIFMRAKGKDANKYLLEPGDAIIYYGCDIMHWREKFSESQINVQFMLHYVKKNGKFGDRRYDRRVKLGLPNKV